MGTTARAWMEATERKLKICASCLPAPRADLPRPGRPKPLVARELHQKQCTSANKWLVFVTGDGGMATQMTRERLKWSQQSEGGFRSGGFRSTVFPRLEPLRFIP
jgi:hypothetical protein